MLVNQIQRFPISQTKTTLKGIPNGGAGVRVTLKEMVKLIKEAKTRIRLRELALSIVANLPPKCWSCEAKAIQAYVYNTIRYVRDIDGIETIAIPEKTLEYGQGDCDDMVILAATLLQAIGHPVRLVAVGFNNKNISHVLLETMIGDKWQAMELIEPIPFGSFPPNVTRKIYGYIKS